MNCRPGSNTYDLTALSHRALELEVGAVKPSNAQDAAAAEPINTAGAFEVHSFDLSTSAYAPLAIAGYGVLFLREGTTPGARLDVECGGRWDQMAPGDSFQGHFTELRVSRSSTSIASGSARVLVLKSPRVAAALVPTMGNSGALGGGAVGPSGAATQAQGSTGNGPVAVTDGVSLQGVKGWRVVVSAPDGETISNATGEVRIHHLGAARARWARNPGLTYSVDVSGGRDLAFADEDVSVPEGRVYAEAVSVETSGAGALTVTIETWG